MLPSAVSGIGQTAGGPAGSCLRGYRDILKINALMEEMETPREIMDLIASLALPAKAEHPAHSQIEPALHYIHQHYTEDIHLEDAAGAAYYPQAI